MLTKKMRLIGASIAFSFGTLGHYLFDDFEWHGLDGTTLAKYVVHFGILSLLVFVLLLFLLRKAETRQATRHHDMSTKPYRVLKMSLFVGMGAAVGVTGLRILFSEAAIDHELVVRFLLFVGLCAFAGSYTGMSLLLGLRNQEPKTR